MLSFSRIMYDAYHTLTRAGRLRDAAYHAGVRVFLRQFWVQHFNRFLLPFPSKSHQIFPTKESNGCDYHIQGKLTLYDLYSPILLYKPKMINKISSKASCDQGGGDRSQSHKSTKERVCGAWIKTPIKNSLSSLFCRNQRAKKNSQKIHEVSD